VGQQGAGFYFGATSSGAATVSNCVFTSNTQSGTGTTGGNNLQVFVGKIYHNTFYGNTTPSNLIYASVNSTTGTHEIKNNIFAANTVNGTSSYLIAKAGTVPFSAQNNLFDQNTLGGTNNGGFSNGATPVVKPGDGSNTSSTIALTFVNAPSNLH